MNANFFARNRITLSNKLHGGISVFRAYDSLQKSHDMAHVFEQEANFWYLCGISEAGWQLVINGVVGKSWLIAPDVDETHRTFDGGLTNEQAKKISHVDYVLSKSDGEVLLRDLAKKHSLVYTLGEHPHRDYFNFIENPAQKKLMSMLERTFQGVRDCRKELSSLRSIKQPEEIAALKKAIRLTTDAFEIVKKKLPDVGYEYEVEAEFDFYFKRHGARHAYEPIVADGANACTLHYSANSMKLKNNSLLLMDVGARINGYVADITRTYAVGKPTQRQTLVHSAVEGAHQEIIKLLKPGLSVVKYHEQVDVIMKQALQELDLLKTFNDDVVYRMYFPHAISHGLGIDPHDPLGSPTEFQPGMVVMVEPGIYIPKEKIGMRLEDAILITENGHQNLSGHLSTEL